LSPKKTKKKKKPKKIFEGSSKRTAPKGGIIEFIWIIFKI